uniref:Uncharacterized protein n=1 Tax=Arion vulgaris TaxID=1028688 RepID=A0A0B7BN80_9EUPU
MMKTSQRLVEDKHGMYKTIVEGDDEDMTNCKWMQGGILQIIRNLLSRCYESSFL